LVLQLKVCGSLCKWERERRRPLLAWSIMSSTTSTIADVFCRGRRWQNPSVEGWGLQGRGYLIDHTSWWVNCMVQGDSLICNIANAPTGISRNAALVRTAAYQAFKVEYFGKEAHAAARPYDGINALDALITAYNAISVLRQQTKPGDSKSCSAHDH
jgi:hypothetical protein